MSDRLKRSLLIIGFVLVTLSIAFALYYFFFRARPEPGAPGVITPPPIGGLRPGQPSSGSATTTPTGPGGLPKTTGVSIPGLPKGVPTAPRSRVIREEVTRSLALGRNGLRSYNPADGRFYRISEDGQATALSNQTFYDVEKIDWANSADKAVLSYPDGSNILYDFETDKQYTLPRHWEDFGFSPNDDKLISKSIGNNEDNRFLVVSNPDGTSARPIESMGTNQDKVHVSWSPNNQVVAYSFTGEPLGFDRQSIILVGQNQENFKALVVEGRGFIPSWSPSGQNLLYSVYNSSDGYAPTIWISGAAGDEVNANRRNIGLNTWADKCAWQSESVAICGVPIRLPQGAGLQRDIARGIPDAIYRVNMETGELVNLGTSGNASVSNIVVSQDGSKAFFTDETTGRLISFDLE